MAIRQSVFGLLIFGMLTSGCADLEDAPAKLDDAAESVPLAQRVGGRAAQTAATRRPIVLVAGLMQDANTFAPLTKALKADRFDVTVFVPPDFGLGNINDYAALLGKTVDEVVKKSGAKQVDLIGHSEGGLTARRYVQATENAPVHTLVSLGSPQQGTEVLDLKGDPLNDLLMRSCKGLSVACQQMGVGSLFLVELNEQNDPTPGDVRYVSLGTEKDAITQPVARSAIPGAEHVVMQQACPGRNVGHFGLLSDGWVYQVILSTLSGGPAKADCSARPVGGQG